jgi:hypothetical protein
MAWFDVPRCDVVTWNIRPAWSIMRRLLKRGNRHMRRFTDAVRKSLASQNWYSAVYMALTLPDICARIESDDGKTSRDKYVAWFDRYLRHKYERPSGISRAGYTFLTGNDCYALRCALLHEGGSDITSQRCREVLDRFHFVVGGAHCSTIDSLLQLDVSVFCGDICDSVAQWERDFRARYPDKIDRFDTLVRIYTETHDVIPGVRSILR